jgi:hypothetical protein
MSGTVHVEFMVDAAALEYGFLRLLRLFSLSNIPPVFHIHTPLMCNCSTVTLATEGILKQNISLSLSLSLFTSNKHYSKSHCCGDNLNNLRLNKQATYV